MANQIRRSNFDRMCRLCLEFASDKSNLFPLFISENNIPGFYGRFLKEFKESIPEVIATNIGIEIDPTEKLPRSICSSCEKQLIALARFRQACLRSNERLLKFRLNDEADDFDTDDDVPLDSLTFPELILVDGFKNEFKEEDVEMDSSSDSVWDNLSDKMTSDVTDSVVKSSGLAENRSIKTDSQSAPKKAASVKRSKTIPLITPTTPIVSVNCDDDAANSCQSEPNKSPPKNPVKYHYPKKPKMCTVCGIIVDRLRDHMRTHPDALEYSCANCPKKYLTKKGLSKHIRHQHTEESDQSSCEYEYYNNKNGQKTVRKPLAKPHKWKRNVAKVQRNFGQSYISTKGIEVPEKRLKEPCTHICRMKCTTKITHRQREDIFKHFWSICDLTQKRVFLIRHIEHIIPKYRRSNGLRSLNYAYFFQIGENRIQVCKTFFVKTLDISHVFIKTAIKKFNSEKGHLEGERRGKCKNVKK